MCIPVAKVERAQSLISEILEKKNKKTTLKQLQKLCGFLKFLCRAIIPGRAFTRRLYAHSAGILKPHHHIRVNPEMRSDLVIWNKFLAQPEAFSCPFMDFSEGLSAHQIQMYSDASKNQNLGFSGICQDSWMYGVWGDFIPDCNPCIKFLELYAVVATVLNWIERFKNKRVILFCDNESVCSIINKSSSSCSKCMILVRILVLHCMTYNVCIFARHLRSKANFAADSLSRLKFDTFFDIKDSWDPLLTPVPQQLWPVKKYGKFSNGINSILAKKRKADGSSKSSTSSSSRLSASHINNILEQLKYKQHRNSTMKMYHNVWCNFNKFLIRLDRKPTSWEDRVSLYGAYLVDQGIQSSTLKSYVPAIKHTLKTDGVPVGGQQGMVDCFGEGLLPQKQCSENKASNSDSNWS